MGDAMTSRIAVLLGMGAGLLLAADPPGFVLWRTTDLKGLEQKLAAKVDPRSKSASEPLGTFPNHLFALAHREASGEAELHETQTDIFVVESGEASLVVGGKVAGARTTGPGEVRGSSIEGGRQVKLAAGDIVHIPAKVPHQLLLQPGKQFTYFVVKVDTP
jgi:mannose-6-phosphate isomerase-like protein (cupin superfamily)